MKKTLLTFVVGFVVAVFFMLFSTAQIVSTNKVSFCASCHEMKVFHETWKMAAHGTIHKGAARAKCVDCHLPHGGFMKYVITKIAYGINDYFAHITGKKATVQHWIAHWQRKKPYVHKAYESGCKSCHKQIIGNGVPLKAITAHKAYLIGETEKTCISCHHMVGHGDVLAVLLEKSEKK